MFFRIALFAHVDNSKRKKRDAKIMLQEVYDPIDLALQTEGW